MKITFTLLACLFFINFVNAQVGIGTTTPDLSSQLEIVSSDKGVLIPRISLANRPGSPGKATPVEGLLVYQIDNDPGFYYYDGATWQKIAKNSDRPSTSFARFNATPSPQVLSGAATALTFNLTNMSGNVTPNIVNNATSFTIQTTGLYNISYSIYFNFSGSASPWSYILPSDSGLADQLFTTTLDFLNIVGYAVLKGQATIQLTAGTSLRLMAEGGSGAGIQRASLSITKL